MTRQAIEAAFALFESGRLAAAEQAWREVLAREPDHPDALHLLGYILAITGRADEGLRFLGRAIECAPRVAGIRSNRALVLHGLGRDDEALQDLRRALDLDPRLPAALHLLGSIHLSRGRIDEAASAYRRAISIDPRMAAAHVGLGSALAARGERDASLASYQAALAADPRDREVHYNLGVHWESCGDLEKAEACYRRALDLDANHFQSLNNLGVILRRTGREAQARESLERALAHAPRNADVLNNVGISRQRGGQIDDAISAFMQASAARPGFAAALVNWGNALQDRGDLGGAGARYAEALRAAPGFAEARYGAAQVALRQQRFDEGWEGYEARFETSPPFTVPRTFAMPRLTRENLAGAERIGVWSEQGLGDQVLYSTLLTELERLRIPAVVEADARLLAAYRRRFPRFDFVAAGAGEQAFAGCDRHVPIASLPRLFRPTAASFESQPQALFSADGAREAEMARVAPRHCIGVSWRSFQRGERQAVAERKSIPLEHFARLGASVPLLDLQYGDVQAERQEFEARHPGRLVRIAGLDLRDDMEGVLAAIAACERVITASNALAHLAGALGKPTWLVYLGAREPFYYWVPGPDGRSLWYPSVEIVSDPSWTTWEAAFDALGARLAAVTP